MLFSSFVPLTTAALLVVAARAFQIRPELDKSVDTAPFTEDVFKQVVAKRSNEAMKEFVLGWLESQSKVVESNVKFDSLIPQYSGTLDSQSWARLKQELKHKKWIKPADESAQTAGNATSANSSGRASTKKRRNIIPQFAVEKAAEVGKAVGEVSHVAEKAANEAKEAAKTAVHGASTAVSSVINKLSGFLWKSKKGTKEDSAKQSGGENVTYKAAGHTKGENATYKAGKQHRVGNATQKVTSSKKADTKAQHRKDGKENQGEVLEADNTRTNVVATPIDGAGHVPAGVPDHSARSSRRGGQSKMHKASTDVDCTPRDIALTFQPGQLGIGADWSTGWVQRVLKDSQATKLGIKVGWTIRQVDGEPYREELVDSRREGTEPFSMVFREEPCVGNVRAHAVPALEAAKPNEPPAPRTAAANSSVAEPAAQADPPMTRQVTLTLQPGEIGIAADWETGEVLHVSPYSQARDAGVQIGWTIQSVNGQSYKEEVLDMFITGKSSYQLTFEAPVSQEAPSSDTVKAKQYSTDVTETAQAEGKKDTNVQAQEDADKQQPKAARQHEVKSDVGRRARKHVAKNGRRAKKQSSKHKVRRHAVRRTAMSNLSDSDNATQASNKPAGHRAKEATVADSTKRASVADKAGGEERASSSEQASSQIENVSQMDTLAQDNHTVADYQSQIVDIVTHDNHAEAGNSSQSASGPIESSSLAKNASGHEEASSLAENASRVQAVLRDHAVVGNQSRNNDTREKVTPVDQMAANSQAVGGSKIDKIARRWQAMPNNESGVGSPTTKVSRHGRIFATNDSVSVSKHGEVPHWNPARNRTSSVSGMDQAAQRNRDLASNLSRNSGKVAAGERDVASTKRSSERNAESLANVTQDSRAPGWAFAVEDLTQTRLAPRNFDNSSHTLGSSQGSNRLLKAQTERLPAEGAVLRSSSHIAATLSKQISELRKNLAEEEASSKEDVTKQRVQYELTLREQRNVTAALVHRIENLNDEVHALTQEVAQLHLQALRLRDTGEALREELTALASNMSTGQEFLKLAMMPPDDPEAKLQILRELEANETQAAEAMMHESQLKMVEGLQQDDDVGISLLQIENQSSHKGPFAFVRALQRQFEQLAQEEADSMSNLKMEFEDSFKAEQDRQAELSQQEDELDKRKASLLKLRELLHQAVAHLEKTTAYLEGHLTSVRSYMARLGHNSQQR